MMTNRNMILMFSLILQLLVGSVYSGRVDSTFDSLKEQAYNTFGAVKDSAGDAMGSVKNTVWPSHTPASAPNVVAGHPSQAPATTGHHRNHQHQHHSHPKFHANGPAPISTTGRYGFASDSVGSMNDAMKKVHKVTIHTATHDPTKPAYNDVTGDPDKAVRDWANDLRKQLGGYAATHQQAAGIKEKDPIPEPYTGGPHKQKVAPAPKSSTTQERLLRESYKKKGAHSPFVAPTNVVNHSPSPMTNDPKKKLHYTVHTANHKFNDVTGYATATFHDWDKDGHGKAAPVPKSSTTHKRGLGESHYMKHHRIHDLYKSYARSPSPMTNARYGDAILHDGPDEKLHNTIHASVHNPENEILPNTMNPKFSDVTGDASSVFHGFAKSGHKKPAPVPTSSATHKRGLSESREGKHSHTLFVAPTTAAHHKQKGVHANSPFPVTKNEYGNPVVREEPEKKLHTTIHTARPKFNDVTGDAAATFSDWAKDGHGSRGSKSHSSEASSPRHSPETHNAIGAPISHSHTKHERNLGQSSSVLGDSRTHAHASNTRGPTVAGHPTAAPSSLTRGYNKQKGVHANSPFPMTKNEYGDPVVHEEPEKKLHITIHTARSKFNDVTGDAAATFSDWAKDGHGSRGSKSHSSEASSPRHSPETHNAIGAPISHSHKKHERNLGQSSSVLGASKTHAHASNTRGPTMAGHPTASPSPLTHGYNKPHKGTVHVAVNDNYNTVKDAYNDVTGDEASAYNDWGKDPYRSYGSHQ